MFSCSSVQVSGPIATTYRYTNNWTQIRKDGQVTREVVVTLQLEPYHQTIESKIYEQGSIAVITSKTISNAALFCNAVLVGLAQGTSVIPPEAIYGPKTKPLSPPTQITPVIHGEYNAMDTAELSPSTTLLAPLGERRGASDITTLQLQTNTLSSQLSL